VKISVIPGTEMVFTDEDKALIKNLYLMKGYEAGKLMSVFPDTKLETE